MNEIQDISGAVRQKLDKNYARFLVLEVVAASPGAVTLALDHRAEFEFAPGYFEGVITSAVGQIAASYSGSSTSNLDWTHLVMQQSIRFVSPAFGERLVAVGKVVKTGRAVSFTSAEIFVEHRGKRNLCALLDMTMRHIPPKA